MMNDIEKVKNTMVYETPSLKSEKYLYMMSDFHFLSNLNKEVEEYTYELVESLLKSGFYVINSRYKLMVTQEKCYGKIIVDYIDLRKWNLSIRDVDRMLNNKNKETR